MKRKIAIWLLKQFPVQARRDVVLESMENFNHVQRKDFLDMFVSAVAPNKHLHRNPVKKAVA
jgi:hypothetical protein